MVHWHRGVPPIKISKCVFSSDISRREVCTELLSTSHHQWVLAVKVENSIFYGILMWTVFPLLKLNCECQHAQCCYWSWKIVSFSILSISSSVGTSMWLDFELMVFKQDNFFHSVLSLFPFIPMLGVKIEHQKNGNIFSWKDFFAFDCTEVPENHMFYGLFWTNQTNKFYIWLLLY